MAILLLLCSALISKAQTITWNNASTNNLWYDAANWTPNTAPGAWLPTSTAQFTDADVRTVGIDFSQGNLSLKSVQNAVNSTFGGLVTIGNSSNTPGVLTLAGTVSSYLSSLTIQNNSTGTGKTMDIVLGSSCTFNPYQATIKVECNISGIGMGISASAGGGGIVELTGQNTYTGLTTLTGGGGSASVTLKLNHPGGGTLPATNSIESIDKGRLEVLSDQTLHNITLGPFCNLVVGNGATLTITGKLKTAPTAVTVQGTGKIVYAPGATLEYALSGGGVATAAEFPADGAPTNVINSTSIPQLTLPGNRVITGTYTGLLTLGNYNFTASAVTYPGSVIVTTGTGKLFITGVSTTPVTFPVHNPLGTATPVTISNGQGLTYGVRVEEGINPAIANNNNAVNRTWHIEPSATPAAPVNVSFAYVNTHGNAGFNYTAPVELGQFYLQGNTWKVVKKNITQTQPVTTDVVSLTGNANNVFSIGNSGAVNPVNNGTIEWVNTSSSGDWYNASNWAPNTAANEWLPTSVASFSNTGGKSIGIDFSQGNLNLARLSAVHMGPGSAQVISITNSSSIPGIISFSGSGTPHTIISSTWTGVEIMNNSTVPSGTIALDLVNTNNFITMTAGTVNIGAAITGVDKALSINTGSLGGNAILSGANTYTGLTSISGGGGSSGGILELTNAGGTTLPATNNVTVGPGGRLSVKTNQTLNNLSLLASTSGGVNIADGAVLTISGLLSTVENKVSLNSSGKIAYSSGATLRYASGTNNTANEFPAANGPTNLIVDGTPQLNLHASRTITGNFSGLRLFLGNNDFTTCSTSPGSNIVTNGTGQLYISCTNGVVTFPVGTPAGLNPITIANAQGLTYGVRVAEGINPALAASNVAVNRTWHIQPNATPAAPVNVSFGYANTHGNPGFNYTTSCELMQYNTATAAWTSVQSGITQVQPLPTAITTLTGGVSSAFVVKNIPQALAINLPVEIAVKKENTTGIISWVIGNTNTVVKEIAVERSTNGRVFETLATLPAITRTYADNNLLSGNNYYRIRVTDINGKLIYSGVGAILNGADGFEIVSLMPNVVTTEMRLNLSAVQKTKMNVVINDVAGRLVQKTAYTAVAGSNQYDINVANLAAGMYTLTAVSANGEVKTVRFVKQ